MKRITSAQLVRYNANSSGRNTGDCVKRALSLAFDMDYNEISKLLVAAAKQAPSNFSWNSPLVYRTVARDLGADKFQYVRMRDAQTVDEFIDEHCQTGTWLLETGRTPTSGASHICCVIDGTLYDSWESQDYYVEAYSKVNISERRAFTDIQDHMDEFVETFKEYVQQAVERYIATYARKGAEWAEQFGYKVIRSRADDFQCVCVISCTIDPTSYSTIDREFTLKFIAVLHPTDTLEDADKILKETARTRVYDRLWTVNSLQKQLEETYEAEQAQGGKVQIDIYGDRKRGNAFYRSMPAWARAACSEIYIDQPGRYSNSYEVTLQEPGTGKLLKFWAATADVLRRELDEYKRTGNLPGEDYDVSDLETGW